MNDQSGTIETELALIRQSQEAMKEDVSAIKEKINGNGRPGLDSRVTALETSVGGNFKKFQQVMMLLTFGMAALTLIISLIDK